MKQRTKLKTPNILIVTTKADIATDYVVLELRKLGASFYRLNTEEFPLNKTSSFFINNNLSRFNWNVSNSDTISLHNLKTIWFRRHRLPMMPKSVIEAHAEYCLRESDWYIRGFLYNQNVRWMSNPLNLIRAESKIVQLEYARRIGFRLPDTIITNDYDESLSFLKEQNYDVIVKPLRLGYLDYGKRKTAIFTNKIDRTNLPTKKSLQLSPVIFQSHIKKAYDVRVTIIGGKVFTAAIDSQTESSAIVDWRRSKNPNLKHYKHELPRSIKLKCLQLMTNLGLNYGAINLILGKNNDYFFLEINPNGQYAWIEDTLKYPISRTIAKWLIKK